MEGRVEASGGYLLRLDYFDLGCVPYQEALQWQKKLADKRKQGLIEDQLLLLEHPPTITFGRRQSNQDLLISKKVLQEKGIEIVKSDRGGKITYHGPGQLVAYFIFHLRGLSVPEFVRRVEQIVIDLLEAYQVSGDRDKKHPGVWVEGSKIAAVGFHMDHQVSTHGVALNVNCELQPFRYFHPCGITDRGVTSMDKELGWHPSVQEVKRAFLSQTMKIFQIDELSEGGSSLPE